MVFMWMLVRDVEGRKVEFREENGTGKAGEEKTYPCQGNPLGRHWCWRCPESVGLDP